MCLVEFRHGVGHLRLNPDAELHAVLLGIAQQTLDTLRQLVLVDHPVAERGVVDLTRILVAEPAVVHHEELTPHRGDIAHHLVHALLVDIEVDTLPGVQQHLPFLVAMSEHILAPPLMEVTGYARETLLGEAQGDLRCDERLTFLQVIFRVVRVHASEEIMEVTIVRLHLQLVVARVADRGTYHVAVVLLSLTVEREHHLSATRVCVAHAILILDDLLAWCQRLLTEDTLVAP